MTSLSVLNFVSAPSFMPKLEPIIHFPQVNPLVPGLKVLEGVCFAQKLVTFSEGSAQKNLSPKHLIKFYREKKRILETVRLQSCSKVRFIWGKGGNHERRRRELLGGPGGTLPQKILTPFRILSFLPYFNV